MPENQPPQKPQLLIADDSRIVRMSVAKLLGDEYQVHEAADGLAAWEMLQANPEIRLLFSDIRMPRLDGYELLEAVRKSEDGLLSDLPVIILAGIEDSDEEREKMLELGATDLISKPFHSAELKSRTRSYLKLSDKLKQLEQSAPLDKRTGLASADYFLQQTDVTLSLARRQGHSITLARIDIENFDQLRQEYGNGMLGKIIATVSKLLASNLRKEDLASHLGDNRFALMLPCGDPDGASVVLQRIRQRLRKVDLRIGEKLVHIPFGAGIVSHTVDEEHGDAAQLLSQAEEALRQAQARGAEQTVLVRDKEEPLSLQEMAQLDIQIDALLQTLAEGKALVSDEEFALAMKKFLPLMARADKRLKLGLGKVVAHLQRRLG